MSAPSRHGAGYLREIVPSDGAPTSPCVRCGDRVFYQYGGVGEPWTCRGCFPPLGEMGWRFVECRHSPTCTPDQHARSNVFRWFVVSALTQEAVP